MKIIYLATPYTSTGPLAQEKNFVQAKALCAHLMTAWENEAAIYSPIVHGHSVDPHLSEPVLTSRYEFWLRQGLALLAASDQLLIAPMKGWRESRGIARELSFARRNGLAVGFLQFKVEGVGKMFKLETLGLFAAEDLGGEIVYV